MSTQAAPSATETVSAPRGAIRDRIIAAARDLFYRFGIRAVGVEAIAEAAGTNKMTLYRHFGSKDALIAECLRTFAVERRAEWDEISQGQSDDPLARLQAWIRYIGALMIAEADRGCALANAAVEIPDRTHPVRQMIETLKKDQRDQLVEWCRAAGYREPVQLAEELFLLLEGAMVSIQSVGIGGPASRVGRMMEAIIDQHAREERSSNLQ